MIIYSELSYVIAEVLRQHTNLNIPLYVQPSNGNGAPGKSLETVIGESQASLQDLRESMDTLFDALNALQ